MSEKTSIKKIGLLTSGGDAPGMNAAIRSLVRYGITKGFEMIGIERGYHGLLRGEFKTLTPSSVSDLIQRGGTVLQTARSNEFKTDEGVKKGAQIAKDYGLDALVVVGGDGSFRGAQRLSEHGIKTIGIPGTIDNDISCTEYTIGYDTALNTAMEAVDKIRDTATSHQRCSIIEVMGRNAGYIAIDVAIATGAEMVFVPEKHASTPKVQIINKIIDDIKLGQAVGKKHHIIIIAEGVGASHEIAQMVEESTGIETRATILGHIQRGGSPTIKDRVIAAQMGAKAIDLLIEGKTNRVVVIKDGQLADFDIDEGLSMKKTISEYDFELVSNLSRSVNHY